MTKIYFGAGLFNKSQQDFNKDVVSRIRNFIPEIEVYLPQENEAINDKSGYADSMMIAQADTDELASSDIMVAVLDGDTIDAGVATEVGIAYANNIPVYGLYTDIRQGTHGNRRKIEALDEVAENQFHYLNLYTTGIIKLNGDIFTNSSSLMRRIAEDIKNG